MRSPCRLLFIAATLTLALMPTTPASAAAGARCPNADELPGRMTVREVKIATLCLINAERRSRGLAPLHQHDGLTLAGARHAKDMVRARYFAHDSRSGDEFDDRIVRTGYTRGVRASIGENLAWGSGTLATPRSIVRSWMRSPGHRRNILGKHYREIGIGVVRATPGHGDGATYATEFGRRW